MHGLMTISDLQKYKIVIMFFYIARILHLSPCPEELSARAWFGDILGKRFCEPNQQVAVMRLEVV